MSRIITNGGAPLHRGGDFCTLDQMMNAVLNTYGPVAQLMTEMCDRMTAIEEKLGIERPAPIVDSGDIEC